MACRRKCPTPRLATLCAAVDELGMSGLVLAALYRETGARHQAVGLDVATTSGEELSAASGLSMTTQHRDSVPPIRGQLSTSQ